LARADLPNPTIKTSERVSEERPFASLAAEAPRRDRLRAAISAATRRPEQECLPPLLEAAALPPERSRAARALASRLITTLRAQGPRLGVEALVQEYALTSEEGVALMCLAEALLRIPDAETQDALIRDKIGAGDWRAHLGHSPSLFVNAATWGLVLTGKLTATPSEDRLSAALRRLLGHGGETLIRRGVDLAMRMLGEQFVMAETIEEALVRARKRERAGFRYSYDMLGEAAATAEDAARYLAAYEAAIRAIGQASAGRGVYEGPGVSIKLSALHPRYSRAQRGRVMGELLPRLLALARSARELDIGFNIDAEEANRLELSLDLLEALCFDSELQDWNGVGFVVQAYSKRAPFVIDALVDLARRSRRRLMLRLVKGAYWDSEIKQAQVAGLDGFPVFTRKIHTDVSYLACARKMLEAGDALYPQFATHNAMTLAAIHEMAGEDRPADAFEFQCLHGMGEPLYEEVVGPGKLGRPCRIYAPVGSYETLLAYLVRRLIENGANTSFVNQVADPSVPIEDLLADPVEQASASETSGTPHPAVLGPPDLYAPRRKNSAGLDLTDERVLVGLAQALPASAERIWLAAPILADGVRDGHRRPVRNPARPTDVVGSVVEVGEDTVDAALRHAEAAAPTWAATNPADRASALERAAEIMEARRPELIGLIVREAGRTLPNAVSEIREAVDFLRYYAAEIRDGWSDASHRPLGPVACISPWNFPLAIFAGQVAAALAAGNVVLAKPAEETPLVAAEAVAILHGAGVPVGALQLLPGNGGMGAALVADPRVRGVVFTGSTDVARSIQRALSGRLNPDGNPVPLIAETGGQNAMIVDSSALAEQVVGDVLASAFDSAGQRCSSLRLLCLQEDVADRIVRMIEGGMAELAVGDPGALATDLGPVISEEARAAIAEHVKAMRRRGFRVVAPPLPAGVEEGCFVGPTLIEIEGVGDLGQEVFGPVLHVLRFPRERMDDLVAEIAATGYGLTFGLHSRIDRTIERVTARAPAGNVYVNRNMIGAVVGTQPFGGHGLSGTGPKAGGPLYLRRLLSATPAETGFSGAAPAMAEHWAAWLEAGGRSALAQRCRRLAARSPLGFSTVLPGPAGERNVYSLYPKGSVLCRARSDEALFVQIGAVLATGNVAQVDATPAIELAIARLPDPLRDSILISRMQPQEGLRAALVHGGDEETLKLLEQLATRPGPIVPVHAAPTDDGDDAIPLEWLVAERCVSVNTAAAGGNVGLLALAT
jgi:RHH-type proline utilization regulon transcriptional repressor/proline dehydrogenase/delta 1-pyrroline-5-carboxylate dehydrogenase